MPFELSPSVVTPEIESLLKVRAWIAEHGFCSDASNDAGNGCFWKASRQINGWRADGCGPHLRCMDVIRDALVARYGPAPDGEVIFDVPYLSRHNIDTAAALEVLDAAITRVQSAASRGE